MDVRISSLLVRRFAFAPLVLSLLTTGLIAASPAEAAVGTPEILGPTGDTVTSPELTWQRVDSATGYEVQVDNNTDFASPEWQSSTVNTISVPTKVLPPGNLSWRVRAKDASGVFGSWSASSMNVKTVSAPTLLGPEDNADLTQPSDPPLLQWEGVPGAASYTVEVDTETEFVSPDTYTTKASSFVVPVNQAPEISYWWRVRATLPDGVVTDFSAPFSYRIMPIAIPEITGPTDDEDISDVVLDWNKVDGAKWYELQIDDDFDFSSPDTAQVPSRIYGTRFSPRTTFANDQYYWRVRAVDLSGHPTEWVRLDEDRFFHFDRVWEDTPRPVYPMGTDTQFVGDDLYFEWTPVRHASNYELWVSTDENFTYPSPYTHVCPVVGTTYTPGELDDECMPAEEGKLYYWKVRPMDRPFGGSGVPGIFSARTSFVYDDSQWFTGVSPAQDATVDVPTLRWDPVPHTEKYDVELLRNNGTSVFHKETYATSVTPFGMRALDPADGPFTWRVTALDAANRTSTILSRRIRLSGQAPATGDPLSPITAPGGDPATLRAPRLRWQPFPGADHYRLHFRNNTTGNWYESSSSTILGSKLPYPAATDFSSSFLAAGSYDWYVTAHDLSGIEIASGLDLGRTGTFTITALEMTHGQRLALSGTALDNENACTKTLADGPGEMCTGLPATPVLDWSPVPGASYYRVHISKDGNFTTGSLAADPPMTSNTRWAPTFTYPQPALEDSTAQTAYYWYIQPCKTKILCGPDPRSTIDPADHAFKKTSPKIRLLAPAQDDPGTEADDATGTEITFTWEDYFDRNQATTYAATGETSPQSAMRYQFQIDDQPTFASPFDSSPVYVDQPTYTAADRLYPEGPLYWRVQPIDGAGNPLGWSEVRTVVKRSDRPHSVSPVSTSAADSVPGTVPFRWDAQPFAGKYEIQVAKDGDTNFSTTNLVVATRSTTQPAFTTGVSTAKALPASPLPYVWRVRRVDPVGNAGPWSTPVSFYSLGEAPQQLAPTADSLVGSPAAMFRWTSVAGAVRYRLEYKRSGSTSITSVQTPALSFAPTTALGEETYQWRVSATDVEGATMGTSDWRTFAVASAPTATTLPAIAGSGRFGTTLTGTPPTWNVGDVVASFQWLRSGTPIAGATGLTYQITAADVGRPLTLRVTGSAAGFDPTVVVSNAINGTPAEAPVPTSPATIEGSGKVGTTLTSTLPTWDLDEVGASSQWLRNGTPINGAVNPTYTVVAADVGALITLQVTGTLPGHTTGTSTSNGVTGVLGDAPTATSPPTVAGSGKVGTSLQATPPTWSAPGVSTTLQWLRDDQPIAGATSSSYIVVPADVDHALVARYVGTSAGRTPAAVASAAVQGALGDAPTAGAAPGLSGTGKVGTSLSARAVTWSVAGVSETFQWLRDGVPIPGETNRGHVVVADDLGSQLSARITATAPGRIAGTITSSTTTAVPGDASTVIIPPSVSGTAAVTKLLTATPGTWSGSPALSYAWLRDGAVIPGASGSTYRIVTADAGRRLAVRVTASVPGHSSGTATSDSLAVARLTAHVTVSPGTQRVRVGRTAPIRVTVKAPGLAGPTGTLRLYDGSRLVRTYTLRASQLGVVSTRLTMSKVGKHVISAKYAGSASTTSARGSSVVTVVR